MAKRTRDIIRRELRKLEERFGYLIEPVFVEHNRVNNNIVTSNGDHIPYSPRELWTTGAFVLHSRPHKIYFFDERLKELDEEEIRKFTRHEYNHSLVLKSGMARHKTNQEMEEYAEVWEHSV